jgi:hypothetical protein
LNHEGTTGTKERVIVTAENIIALVFGVLGFVVSIVGFVVSPIVSLRARALEKRLEYRFNLFQNILGLWEHIQLTKSADGGEFDKIMFDINRTIQLYGHVTEIVAFRNLVNAYNAHGISRDELTRKELFAKFEEFFSLSFGTYRKELKLRGAPN